MYNQGTSYGTQSTCDAKCEDSYPNSNTFYIADGCNMPVTKDECHNFAQSSSSYNSYVKITHSFNSNIHSPFGCITSGANIFFNEHADAPLGASFTHPHGWTDGMVCKRNGGLVKLTVNQIHQMTSADWYSQCVPQFRCNACICDTRPASSIPWNSGSQRTVSGIRKYSTCATCYASQYKKDSCSEAQDTLCCERCPVNTWRAYDCSYSSGTGCYPCQTCPNGWRSVSDCGTAVSSMGGKSNSVADRLCAKNYCSCANGVAVPAALTGAWTGSKYPMLPGDCTSHGQNLCESCNDGYYLDGTSCKPYVGTCNNGELIAQIQRINHHHCGSCNSGYRLYQSYHVPQCVANACKCDHGTAVSNGHNTCTSDGLHSCTSNGVCDAGYYSENFGSRYECNPYIASCDNGVVKAQADRTAHHQGCGSCDSGYYLESGLCKPFNDVCNNGEVRAQEDRTRHHHCMKCNAGYGLNWNINSDTYQKCQPCLADDFEYSMYHDDSACIDHVKCEYGIGSNFDTLTNSVQSPSTCAICTAGTFSNDTFYGPCYACPHETYQDETEKTECEPCAASCGTGKRETTACSATTNRVCTQNVCDCANGVAAVGTDCTDHDTNICASCDTGFHLSGTHCVSNVCDCAYGVAVVGTDCTTHGANICTSCTDVHELHEGICTIFGCTDSTKTNYDTTAETDDGSCIDWDDGFCSTICSIEGCMNPAYASYDSSYDIHNQDDCTDGQLNDCATLKDKANSACNCASTNETATKDSITCNNIKSVFSNNNCYGSCVA